MVKQKGEKQRESTQDGLDVLKPEILFYYLQHPFNQKCSLEKQINQIYLLSSNSWAYRLIRNNLKTEAGKRGHSFSFTRLCHHGVQGNGFLKRNLLPLILGFFSVRLIYTGCIIFFICYLSQKNLTHYSTSLVFQRFEIWLLERKQCCCCSSHITPLNKILLWLCTDIKFFIYI